MRKTGELTRQSENALVLTDNQRHFLEFVERLQWGSVAVLVKAGDIKSVRVLARDYPMDEDVSGETDIFISAAGRASWREL